MNLLGRRYADGQRLDMEGFTVRLRVAERARRISLRVDAVRGEVVAIAPTIRRLPEAVAFAGTRRDWISARLAEAARLRPALDAALAPGDSVTVFDTPWILRPDGRRPRIEVLAGETRRILSGCGDSVVDPQLVVRAVRREAQTVFDHRAAVHCTALGVAKPPVSLTDARTRWGSCTPERPGRPASIRLSWRLALAPFAVADYVVAHECAHLLQANHGPHFWALVRQRVGDERRHRAWLREHGAGLHALLPRGR